MWSKLCVNFASQIANSQQQGSNSGANSTASQATSLTDVHVYIKTNIKINTNGNHTFLLNCLMCGLLC